MIEQKESQQVRSILLYLLDKETVTTSEIALTMNLSEKTVRLRLNFLADYLRKNKLGELNRKTRVGIWLNVNPENEKKVRDFCYDKFSMPISENRLLVILGVFLKNPTKHFTLQQLSQEVYLSVPTVSRLLNEAQEWFEIFKITLNRQPNKGHWISYKEIDYRLALRQYIVLSSANSKLFEKAKQEFNAVNFSIAEGTVRRIEKNWDIKLSDDSYINMLVLVTIMITRTQQGYFVDYHIDDDITNYSEYAFAENVVRTICENHNTEFHQDEVNLLAMQLLFNSELMTLTDHDIKGQNEQLWRTVNKMVDIISDILNIDLKSDRSLKSGLLLHLRTAIFRMRYGHKHSDVSHSDVLHEYKQVYRAVWATSIILEDEYQVQISEIELAYISLYVQAAIERQKAPLNVTLVSSQTNAQNTLLVEKLKNKVLGNCNIEVVSQHAFMEREKNMRGNFIIATDFIDKKLPDCRIVRISPALTNSDIRQINHHINSLIADRYIKKQRFDTKCHILFEHELIFNRKSVKSKEEAIEIMCNELQIRGYVTSKYKKTVLERELKTLTSIGNRVAIPHGNQNEINQARVAIMILEEPVKWNEEDEVVVIFLLAMRMKSELEVEITKLFYQQYINLVSDDEKVNTLQLMQSPIEIYKYLIR